MKRTILVISAIIGIIFGTVQIAPAQPSIFLIPFGFGEILGSGETETQQMFILNTGDSSLNWSISEADSSCDSTDDIPWLRVAPVNGTTPAGSSTTVDVTFDSRGLTPGNYNAFLCVNSNDPNTSLVQAPVQLTVLFSNLPPVCDDSFASIRSLWPPNHKFVDISVLGVTNPDGDPITIEITMIEQDEPVDTSGDGSFAPDGTGIGTDTASIRAERSGAGNGRFYHIEFMATDDNGGACIGVVSVGVPHNKKDIPIDDGALYDSTLP